MEDRESKVQSLDEYLGERGLSFPVSDFMLDKTSRSDQQSGKKDA